MDVELRVLTPVQAPMVRNSSRFCTAPQTTTAMCAQVVDAQRVVAALSKQWFDCVVTVNQVAVLTLHDNPPLRLVARIAVVHTLDAEQRAEAIVYHCFRGRFTPNTAVYVSMLAVAVDEATLAMQLQQTSLGGDMGDVAGAADVRLLHQRCVHPSNMTFVVYACCRIG